MKKKIVVKLGSSSLTDGGTFLSRSRMVDFVQQLTHLHKEGHEVVLVSSGAIAAAREDLPTEKGTSIPTKQMLASIGQVRLMHTWAELFALYKVVIGQVLLTQHDFSDETSVCHAQDTFNTLLSHHVLPIVNENDTTATEEICFGDNDILSALVARSIKADLLILLTDQEGFFTADPRHDPQAELIETIHEIDETVAKYAHKAHPDGVGSGGMVTKLEAANFATQNGTATVIASSKTPNVMVDLVAGKKIGTFFTA